MIRAMVVGDKFAFDHFDHYRLVSHHSRLKPSGLSIYKKKHLISIVEEVEMFPNNKTELRNNPPQCTTIGRTTTDCIFSTHDLRTCGVYESAFSTHLPLYVQMPWEKKKVRTSYPQEDNDPSLECGPDLLDRTGEIDWAEDDNFPN
ncbi:uncharacterized protein TNCV_4145891 [Trichonephila clavipes]|nr:uncharacterized protein TNCV_4145891 [Trichonephila clavipes]